MSDLEKTLYHRYRVAHNLSGMEPTSEDQVIEWLNNMPDNSKTSKLDLFLAEITREDIVNKVKAKSSWYGTGGGS